MFAVFGGSIFDFGRTESAEFMGWQYYQMFESAGMQDAIAQGMPEELGELTADGMAADRASIMRSDAWRSLLMIAMAVGCVLLYALGRIKRGWLLGALAVIVLIDLVSGKPAFPATKQFRAGKADTNTTNGG